MVTGWLCKNLCHIVLHFESQIENIVKDTLLNFFGLPEIIFLNAEIIADHLVNGNCNSYKKSNTSWGRGNKINNRKIQVNNKC